MKITIFSHYFTPEIGAPSARIYDLSQQWLKHGHTVDVVTCFPNHPTGKLYQGYKLQKYKYEIIDGINVHRHWTYITSNKGFLKKIIGHFSYFPSSLLFSQWQIKRPDVIIGTSPTLFAATSASSVAFLKRVPFIMEVRDLWPAIFVELGVLKNRHIIKMLECWEMHEYKSSTKIITVTKSFTQNLIDRGIPKQKLYTIPNGADVDFWKPIDSPPEIRNKLKLEDKFIILYIGAHGISHALGKILDSAKILQDRKDIFFLFVGEGAEKYQLLKRAKDLKLYNVKFLDPVEKKKVKEYYALSDLCLVPLRNIPLFDTFIPSKMFEIMAMKKPILGSVHGESADILRRSGCAYIVEPENSEEIAKAILKLVGNRERLRQMGERGREFVLNYYSREILAKQYIDVLTEAIETYHGRKQ